MRTALVWILVLVCATSVKAIEHVIAPGKSVGEITNDKYTCRFEYNTLGGSSELWELDILFDPNNEYMAFHVSRPLASPTSTFVFLFWEATCSYKKKKSVAPLEIIGVEANDNDKAITTVITPFAVKNYPDVPTLRELRAHFKLKPRKDKAKDEPAKEKDDL